MTFVSTQIIIRPFDPNTAKDIEKAILAADLGFNPQNDGRIIRIVIPPLSTEVRRRLVGRVKELGEEAKVSIRNVRRDGNKEAEQAEKKNYEEAARLRNEIRSLEKLDDRCKVDEHVQPELFQVDPHAGLDRLVQLLDREESVRIIEGVDIAHIQGQEAVGALVCFIDGRPFKGGYRRYRIRDVAGIDDYAMIQEVLRRRYRKAGAHGEIFPDVILIDGGLGQLHAATDAFREMPFKPPVIMSLAKKDEILYRVGNDNPIKLPRHDAALRLLQYIRDESHRFAQHYFHILQKKSTFK